MPKDDHWITGHTRVNDGQRVPREDPASRREATGCLGKSPLPLRRRRGARLTPRPGDQLGTADAISAAALVAEVLAVRFQVTGWPY